MTELAGARVRGGKGRVDPDFQGKTGLLLYDEGKEEYVWNTNPLGHLSTSMSHD